MLGSSGGNSPADRVVPSVLGTDEFMIQIASIVKEATVKRFHYETHDQLRTRLADFMAAYIFPVGSTR